MSNFIDHWLNTAALDEATRAKKLRKKGGISPEDYAQAEQTLEQRLSRYVTDDPDKMYYITFVSDMSDLGRAKRGEDKKQKSPSRTKVGINPQSRYDTPNGIYTYPLTPMMFRTMLDGAIGGHGFAQRNPFIALLKPKDYSKILQVEKPKNYSEDQYGQIDYVKTIDSLTKGDESEQFRQFIGKLFSKDSEIRKKIRDTKVRDYLRGTSLVRNVEQQVILSAAKKAGYKNTRNLSELDFKKFQQEAQSLMNAEGISEEKAEILSKMVSIVSRGSRSQQRAGNSKFLPIPTMTTVMDAIFLEVLEKSEKATSRLTGRPFVTQTHKVNDIEYFLLFIESTRKRISEEITLVTINPKNKKAEPAYFSPNSPEMPYRFHILCSMMLGYFDTFDYDVLDLFLPVEMTKLLKKYDIESLRTDLLSFSADAQKTVDDLRSYFNSNVDEDSGYKYTELKPMMQYMWKTLSEFLVKTRRLPPELLNTKEMQRVINFVKFGRTLFHPSRLDNVIRRETRNAFSSKNVLAYPYRILKNSEILESIDHSDYMRQAELGLDSKFLAFHNLIQGDYDLLIDLVNKSMIIPESSENFSEEERAALREIEKYKSGSSIDDDVFNRLSDRFYNPTAEDVLETTEINQLMRSSRRISSYGFLWNITRIMAGENSNRVSPVAGASYKRVPALWNAIWRSIGIDGVADLQDSGTIHTSEPTQAVFFNRAFVEVVDVFDNSLIGGVKKSSMNTSKMKSMVMRRAVMRYTDIKKESFDNFLTLAIPPETIMTKHLDPKYYEIAKSFITLKMPEDGDISAIMSKYTKSQDFADLLIFGTMYDRLRGYFNVKALVEVIINLNKKVPGRIALQTDVMNSQVSEILKFFLRDLKDYTPNEGFGAADAQNDEIKRYTSEFLLPAAFVKYFTRVPYSDTELLGGKINISNISTLDMNSFPSFMVLTLNDSNKIIKEIVSDVTKDYFESNKSKVPLLVKSMIEKELEEPSFFVALEMLAEADFSIAKSLAFGDKQTIDQADDLNSARNRHKENLLDLSDKMALMIEERLVPPKNRGVSLRNAPAMVLTPLMRKMSLLFQLRRDWLQRPPDTYINADDLDYFMNASLNIFYKTFCSIYDVNAETVDFKLNIYKPVSEVVRVKKTESLIIEMENVLNERLI
jgi:hypothetical protein